MTDTGLSFVDDEQNWQNACEIEIKSVYLQAFSGMRDSSKSSSFAYKASFRHNDKSIRQTELRMKTIVAAFPGNRVSGVFRGSRKG